MYYSLSFSNINVFYFPQQCTHFPPDLPLCQLQCTIPARFPTVRITTGFPVYNSAHFPPDFPQCRYYPGAVLFATVHTLPARFPAVQILPRGCPVCWNTWGPPGANLDFKHIKIPPVFPGHCLHFAARGGNCRLNCNKGGAEGVKNGTK